MIIILISSKSLYRALLNNIHLLGEINSTHTISDRIIFSNSKDEKIEIDCEIINHGQSYIHKDFNIGHVLRFCKQIDEQPIKVRITETNFDITISY